MELRRAAPGHGRGCGVGPRTLPPLRPPSSTRPCTLNDRPLISFGTRPYIVRTHVYTGSSQTRVSRRQTWCETPPCPVHTRASYVRISSCSRCSNLGRLPQELAQVVLLDVGVHVPARHITTAQVSAQRVLYRTPWVRGGRGTSWRARARGIVVSTARRTPSTRIGVQHHFVFGCELSTPSLARRRQALGENNNNNTTNNKGITCDGTPLQHTPRSSSTTTATKSPTQNRVQGLPRTQVHW